MGHGSGCNDGNVWEFVDDVMGENVAGNGVVGSVSGGDVVLVVVRVVVVCLRQSLMKSNS